MEIHTNYNVGCSRGFLNSLGIIQAAIYELDIRILARDLLGLLLTAHEQGVLELWMSFMEAVECFAADIT